MIDTTDGITLFTTSDTSDVTVLDVLVKDVLSTFFSEDFSVFTFSPKRAFPTKFVV